MGATVSLEESLKTVRAERVSNCRVCKVLRVATEDEKKIITGWLSPESGLPATDIGKALTLEYGERLGYKISDQSVTRHRNGRCE